MQYARFAGPASAGTRSVERWAIVGQSVSRRNTVAVLPSLVIYGVMALFAAL